MNKTPTPEGTNGRDPNHHHPPTEVESVAPPTEESWRDWPWALWYRQTMAILRLEIKRNFLGRRLIAVYFLSLAPISLLVLRALLPLHESELGNPGKASVVFAILYQAFTLRLAIFFGCVAIFTNLFRGEVMEKTLHYYLLSPVQREVLVLGKYLSGVISAITFFGLSTAACYFLLYAPYGWTFMEEHFTKGPGMSHLFAYLVVSLLACLGYGAVFLGIGLYVRNPIVPAGLILIWESFNFLLPPILQKISVIHYLQSICPVSLPAGPLAIMTEPTSPWISVPGLLGVIILVILASSLRVKTLEITYGTD